MTIYGYGPLHILHSVFSIFCLLGSVWLIFCWRSYSLQLAVTSFSATTFAAEGNSIVRWAEISNAPETSQHRNGWHPNDFNMVFQTYLVASGSENLREAIKLFWTFRIPWGWTYSGSIFPDWVAQFSFGFYSLMLTSLLIGLIVMIFFKPRTWCAFCPMGTMTQAICKLRNRKRGK